MSRRSAMRRSARQPLTPACDFRADQMAELVCHAEQMVIWEAELLESLHEFLRLPADFEEVLELHHAANQAIRHIVSSAFIHPEILGLPFEKARK